MSLVFFQGRGIEGGFSEFDPSALNLQGVKTE